MVVSKMIAAIAAAALLAGCEAKIGKSDEADAGANVSAAGKAEEGSFSINAPGFKMKLDIPESLANRASIDSDSDIVYPGAKMRGIHIEAEGDDGKDGVELSFTSPDTPAKVAGWYRDPARAEKFAITTDREEAGGYALAGTEADDGDPFTLTLQPLDGGGTDARLTLQDKN